MLAIEIANCLPSTFNILLAAIMLPSLNFWGGKRHIKKDSKGYFIVANIYNNYIVLHVFLHNRINAYLLSVYFK